LRAGADVGVQIRAASQARQLLDCRSEPATDGAPEPRRSRISAAALRRACLTSAAELDPFGIRIVNAVIDGVLDLRAANIVVPLHFVGCVFTAAPQLDGADLHELVITTSQLPGLLANGVRLRRDLVLSGSRVTGSHSTSAAPGRYSAIWLTEAEIGGRLLAIGTVIDTPAPRAIQADRTVITGDIRLGSGFRANAGIRLHAMQIGGSVVLNGATVSARVGRALDVAETAIRGTLFLLDDPDTGQRTTIYGRIEMGRATIEGGVRIGAARLTALPAGSSSRYEYHGQDSAERALLVAPGLTVHGPVVVGPGTELDGAMILPGAELHSGAVFNRLILRNPADLALDLAQAQLGAGLSITDAEIEGTVDLANARIVGPVSLARTRLSQPKDRRCLNGVGIRVDGDLTLNHLRATDGAVDLRGSSVDGIVDAEGAELVNPGHRTISLHHARVQGNVRLCQGFSSVGLIMLTRVTVEGRLRCDGAVLEWVNPVTGDDAPSELNPRGSAIEAISATFRSGLSLGWQIRAGGVDLTDAQTSFLADDPAGDWPTRSLLAGFTYRRFAPLDHLHGQGEWRPQVRARWLAQLAEYDPRPWAQVATVLRSSGNESGAEDLLIAQRRCERRRRIGAQSRFWRRVLDVLADVTVGYGYRPARVLLIMLTLIAAVSIVLLPKGGHASMRAVDPDGVVYSPSGIVAAADDPTSTGSCGQGKVRCFNPLLYAVDTVIPIVDLKQRTTWYPARDAGGGWLEWLLSAGTILGWVTSTVFALSFTRLGRTATT
jgi:hypothetical protein